jgi:asparagine synthase (glutamine-hydrolysing)
MCGIAGVFNFNSKDFSCEQSVRRMLSVIRHRGPDESGIYLAKNVGLGSVRLSIIDLISGQQPVCDESGNYWIVYNGEIFNYTELRADLEKRGVHFHTQSDTEVVVQMYATYGAKCLEYFNGQFAFCIWDSKKEELFLARDRVGIRPLFYWKQNNAFAFCSEIKGLFTIEQIDKAISTKSLAQVFTFWTTITPDTAFENIYEIPPGHFMVVNSTSITLQKYWSLNFIDKGVDQNRSLPDAIEEFTELFRDSVKIRLRADVPVGAYLSGGLDSSITTALIHAINPDILNTYSIGFDDIDFDESKYQFEAAAFFNTNHTAFKCSSAEIAEYFQKTIWHTEFPILRTAPTPMYLLSKKVRESNIKVVITGEGADEFLAGYNIFKESKIRRFWANDPDSVIRPRLLNKLYPYLPAIKDSNNFALKMFFGYNLTSTDDPLYSHLLRWHNTSRIKNYFSNDLISELDGYNPLDLVYSKLPDNFMKWGDLSRSQYLEASIFMSGYLLSSQGDRMSMGNSVEGRYPFLDYRVIEFCNNLPDKFKLNSLDEKFLLKKMSKGLIPESIRARSKQAYRAPIASSFFNHAAPAYISELLSPDLLKAFGIFQPEKVESLILKMKSKKNISEIDQMAVAGILSTQLLYNMFINNKISITNSIDNVRVVRDYDH